LIQKVNCTSATTAVLTLAKSATGTVDYDTTAANVAFPKTVTALVEVGERITNLSPLEGFGGITLSGFAASSTNLKQNGSTTTAMSNVTSRHYIVPSTANLQRDFGLGTSAYYANATTLTMKVIWMTSDITDDSSNVFERDTTQAGGTDISNAGSVATLAHYTIPSNYKISTIVSTAAQTFGDGQYVEVTLTLIKAGTGAVVSGGNGDGNTVNVAYTTTPTNFSNDAITVVQATANTITVANVVDAQGSALDTTGNREVYTWTYRTDTTESDNTANDIEPGFHSLQKDRY